jgi:PqqD family protein of HPr-rel-A system
MALLAGLQTRWRGPPVPALAWREWDSEVVVYNRDTGSTHLLDYLAAMILRHLCTAEGGATLAELADVLEGDANIEERQDCIAMIARVLEEFDRLGLAKAESR